MSKPRNYFAIITTAIVVLVVAIIATVVVVMNNSATSGGDAPQSAIINSDTGAVTLGSGENTLTTYVDFMCPACGKFENTYGPDLRKQMDAGKLKMEFHPISILDRLSQGSGYSTRAASALYCVAENDPDATMSYIQMLYSNQPKENTAGLSDSELSTLAQQSGAKNSGQCIVSETYKKYVAAKTKLTPLAPGASSISTPTILLNGQNVTLTGDVNADILSKLK